MIGAAGEVVLGRRARCQPQPAIYTPGDCGACALGGALGLEVAEVYSEFNSTGISNAGEMARCLRCSINSGHADRVIEEAAEWRGCGLWRAFGNPAYLVYTQWFNHVRLAIDAGYYGLACIDYRANGGPDTDHWVLICGARTEGPVAGKTITGEILVSCSASGERWHEARDFLKRLGGYNTLFVRPAAHKRGL